MKYVMYILYMISRLCNYDYISVYCIYLLHFF